jgi:integrase
MAKRREPGQRCKRQAWTVDDARWFLESTWHAREALYAAFVLDLVLGLRRGEVSGLAWDQVDLDDAELYMAEQLQRVRGELVRREVKTETSDAPPPLPDLCVTALKIRKKQQDTDREGAGDGWIHTGLIFHHTARYAYRAAQLRPQLRSVHYRCTGPRITVHGTRKTCASLLAALDVHPRVAMRILRTARSPSRWRSTPKPRPRPPVMRSASSATGSRDPLLPFAAAGRSQTASYKIATGR